MAPGAPRVVGVLGGMGPLATVDFLRKLVQATPARTDQEHVPVVVSAIPQVPDRTAAWLGQGASPLPALRASAQRLVAAGASAIVMPCNTAHLWFDELQSGVALPMLHLVDAAVDAVVQRLGPGAPVGLLATEATLHSGLYTRRRNGDVHWVLPTARERETWITPGIAAVKAGRLPAGRALLDPALQALARRGARAVVLGCTEIPLVLEQAPHAPLLIDATGALARRAVDWALQPG